MSLNPYIIINQYCLNKKYIKFKKEKNMYNSEFNCVHAVRFRKGLGIYDKSKAID